MPSQAGFGGSNLQCVTHILRTRGVGALWSGVAARLPRVAISPSMQFAIVERLAG